MRSAFALAFALVACGQDFSPAGDTSAGSGSGSGSADEWDGKLAARVVDYNAALRIAALRLTGDLPTLDDIDSIATATDPKSAYAAQITKYMQDPRFARQMVAFWQDAMKLGGTLQDMNTGVTTSLDTAPTFAAQLTVENDDFAQLFTGSTNTCPTFDAGSATFTAASCNNGAPTAGVLTDPGMNTSFFSNFGFRRVRWLQEVFACTAFPAEFATAGQDVGGPTPYTGKFPFDSISGGSDARVVNFLDVSALVCANCHSNINHIAPLFGQFDQTGQFQTQIVVPTPNASIMPNVAIRSDYLPASEPTAWRDGTLAPDLPTLGQDIAADPVSTACIISRTWNWAMGKGDIVDGGYAVPADTIADLVAAYGQGHHLRDTLLAIFTSDDFVRF